MRVRKKTSKRVSTRLREGIKKKAASQRRKETKMAKKDITWKSRNKKDIGIPSSFPYKDKIIMQIEESKRQKQEERQRLRAERKAALASDDPNQMDEDSESDDDEEEGNGLSALMESAQKAAREFNNEEESDAMEEDEDEEDLEVVDYEIEMSDDEESKTELEKSRKQYDKIFKSVVDAADVILYVMDARDPEGTRSRKIEEAVLQSQGKRLIFLLNKVDLIPEDVLQKWLTFLQSSFPTIPIKASNGATNAKSFNKKMTQTATAGSLMQALKAYAQKSNLKRSIIVGVVGYPNVGKSSIINALTTRHGGTSKACPVGNMPGVTTSLREVKVDNKLKILDSPGIVFPDSKNKKKSKQQEEAELALLNALPPKMMIDSLPAVTLLIKRLSKSDEMANSFKKLYELPALPAHNVDEFTKNVLIHIARKKGRLGKGGVPNLHAAGLMILNDWRDGKIIGWTLPRSSKATALLEEGLKIPDGARNIQEPPKVEQTSIVNEWAKEFDLDALFGGVFDN